MKALRVVVTDHAPLDHTDDRVLEELDIDLAVHQTVDCHLVAVRQADVPHLTVPGRAVETQNLQTKIVNIKYRESSHFLIPAH